MKPTIRPAEAAALLLLLAACLAPHLTRLAHPSLYADDLVRLATVRSRPAAQTLLLPFNEHVAPLFDLLSRAAWTLAGGRLAATPWPFTLAAILPLPLALLCLWRIVRRATGSPPAALGALAVAGGTALYVEAVAWYSGSSFLWALLATLLAFDASACRRPILAALAAAAAPAFSAIGLLAAPIASARALLETELDPDPPSVRSRVLRALAPILALAVYLAVGRLARVDDLLGQSVRRNLDLAPALAATLRAPVSVLLADLIRLRDASPRPAAPVELVLGAAFYLGMIAWAVRFPRARPLLLGGLGLILGGYAVTFGVRAGTSGGWALRVERYHLFPQFGLALIAGAALAGLPARPARLAALVLALALPALHAREVIARGRLYRFPDQAATLAALERLEASARRLGLTRPQAVAALGPVRPPWIDLGVFDLTVLLLPMADTPRLPDPEARASVLASLTPHDLGLLRRHLPGPLGTD